MSAIIIMGEMDEQWHKATMRPSPRLTLALPRGVEPREEVLGDAFFFGAGLFFFEAGFFDFFFVDFFFWDFFLVWRCCW